MSDYRRILSYLYRYENRIKKDCKGFIKAEQRNDTLKLTVQLQDEYRIGNMNLCFYQKADAGWKLWNLEQLSIENDQEEKVLHYNKKDLPEQFDIQEQCGVVLYYQDSLYYGSVWIGEEIPVDLTFSNQVPGNMISGDGRKQEQEITEKTDKGGTDRRTTASGAATLKETASGETAPEKRVSGAATLKETVSGETASEERVLEAATLKETVSGETAPEKRVSEAATLKETAPEETVSEERVLGAATLEKTASGAAISEEAASEVTSSGTATSGKADPENPNRKEPDVTESGLKVSEKEEPDRRDSEVADILEPIRDQAPAAEKIFNSAFYEGYQINTSQLMHMGEEANLLAENQFLRKGYGKYHHLLAGRVRYDGEDRYCIGVPGVYENREKYMAQLYQFPVFLSLTENRVKTGRFGYWLHILS